MKTGRRVVGLDIGGSKCAVLLGESDDSQIKILRKEIIESDPVVSPYGMIDQLMSLIDRLTEGENFDAIGVSCGGPLDSDKGCIQCPPNLPLWEDIHITDILEDKYHTDVFLENDANACALAEWKLGAGIGTQNMIFLTFGTGLGAGLILNGKLYTGANGNAGELGHIRLSENGPAGFGKRGSFEGFCSGGGLAQLGYTMALEKLQTGKCPSYFDPESPAAVNAKTLAAAAAKGDETAIEVYRVCGEYLGRGLAILVDLLNPECIVLGSVFARSRDLIWPTAEKMLRKEAIPASFEKCRILPAALGEQIGDYAALMIAACGRE